jgi:hypothetical protein
MTFPAIFYDRHGHRSAPTRGVPAADAAHLPDIILVVPGRITYDHDGHDPKGRPIYRERVTD